MIIGKLRGSLRARLLGATLATAAARAARIRLPKVSTPVTAWQFHGGGWGHGVGMCQTGAVGRAEAGQSYREILRYYFNGAEVAPIY